MIKDFFRKKFENKIPDLILRITTNMYVLYYKKIFVN